MTEIHIKGMSCQHCVASVKQALEKLPKISNVMVNLEKGIATFDGEVEDSSVKEVVEQIGFEVVS